MARRPNRVAILRRRNAALRRQLAAAKNDPMRPWGEKQIAAEAERRAGMTLDPEAKRISAEADKQRAASLAAAAAASQALSGIAPRIQAGYAQAGETVAGMTGAFSAERAAQIRAAQEAAAAFAKGQGQAAVPGADATALQDTGAAGGYYSGASLAGQGAALAAGAERAAGVPHLAAQAEIAAIKQKTDEQLMELASKRPELVASIRDELYDRELQKLQGRLSIRESNRQDEATRLYQQKFGLDVIKAQENARHHRATEKAALYRNKISQQRYNLAVQQHELAIQKAADAGRNIAPGISAKKGYLVDQRGRPILDANGKKITVPKEKPGANNTERNAIRSEARDLYGDPVENPDYDPSSKIKRKKFKYVKRGGGFTNDPKKADRDGVAFADAQAQLMEAYGLTKAQARAYLRSIGWKPDGVRPKPVGKSRPG